MLGPRPDGALPPHGLNTLGCAPCAASNGETVPWATLSSDACGTLTSFGMYTLKLTAI